MSYDYNIIKYLLYSADNERKRLLETIRLIIKDGVGCCHLHNIVHKSFLETGDEYYVRLCYYVEKDSKNIKYLFDALIEWYGFWEEEFSDFKGNEEKKYSDSRLKTWTYCMLNGIPEIYARLSNEVSITLTEEEVKYLKVVYAVQQKVYEDRHFVDKENIDAEFIEQIKGEMQNLVKELDREKIINVLRGKKIIFYTNGKWAYDKLQEIQIKYELECVWQESALELSKGYKKCDYIIFVTSQAQHDIYQKLVAQYGREKIILVSSQNPELAMKEFIEQLLGYSVYE